MTCGCGMWVWHVGVACGRDNTLCNYIECIHCSVRTYVNANHSNYAVELGI